MKRLLPLLLLCAGPAFATTTITWTNPTTNTDGSAIPASGVGSLTSARIEYGTCVGTAFGVKAGEVTRTMPATSAVLNLPVGQGCARVLVSNTYGSESAPSNVAAATVPPPVPGPPSNATVTVTLTLNLTSNSPITVAMSAPVVSKTP